MFLALEFWRDLQFFYENGSLPESNVNEELNVEPERVNKYEYDVSLVELGEKRGKE